MSYIQLETSLFTHPKVLGLSRVARDLYVGALMYSRANLTDGWIPLEALGHLDPLTGAKASLVAAKHLDSAGLFTRKRGRFTGYYVHDYAKHQQSKEDVERAREQARDRKRRERERKAQGGNVTERSRRDTERDIVTVTPTEVEEKRGKNLKALKDEKPFKSRLHEIQAMSHQIGRTM